jgi:xanthine/CO dehydrogenase XdhC/CoxF family maturation factor
MKELQQIIQRVAENPEQPWALATLVQTKGSTYRKPGARLLIDRQGATLGVLSGGCLEEEIGRRGRDVIGNGLAVLLSFDTRQLYGCDGQLEILVEPLPAAIQNGNLITNIGRSFKNRETCRVRTRFEGETLASDLLPPDVFLTERRGVFIETLQLPVRLLLFGTGPEIEPIIHLAEILGWTVGVFEHPSELSQDFRTDTQTAAVIMNDNFVRDLLALHRVLPLQFRYVGLLGPRKRYTEILARLGEHVPLDFKGALDNLFAPAGLDIGSEAPEEIALSIAAEVEATLAGRVGGFLRERRATTRSSTASVSGRAA